MIRYQPTRLHGVDVDQGQRPVERGITAAQDDEILAINEVLDRFARIEPRKAEVVKLRYFVGMTLEETAEALGISTPTAKRDWIYARAWLFRELKRDE